MDSKFPCVESLLTKSLFPWIYLGHDTQIRKYFTFNKLKYLHVIISTSSFISLINIKPQQLAPNACTSPF